jgi:hypothetical protein
MRYYLPVILIVPLATLICSCTGSSNRCEAVKEWQVQNYRIVKSKCPDLVLASYFVYQVYIDGERKGSSASQIDSCIFSWQSDNESFFILNVCNNSIREMKAEKLDLNVKFIDSVTIYSKALSRTQLFTTIQIEKFVKDWNNSKTRGYSDRPFDSAFSDFPSYQYKLTVFSNGNRRPFYGYNYLILDSSKWKFEMNKTAELDYFHNFWKK